MRSKHLRTPRLRCSARHMEGVRGLRSGARCGVVVDWDKGAQRIVYCQRVLFEVMEIKRGLVGRSGAMRGSFAAAFAALLLAYAIAFTVGVYLRRAFPFEW